MDSYISCLQLFMSINIDTVYARNFLQNFSLKINHMELTYEVSKFVFYVIGHCIHYNIEMLDVLGEQLNDCIRFLVDFQLNIELSTALAVKFFLVFKITSLNRTEKCGLKLDSASKYLYELIKGIMLYYEEYIHIKEDEFPVDESYKSSIDIRNDARYPLSNIDEFKYLKTILDSTGLIKIIKKDKELLSLFKTLKEISYVNIGTKGDYFVARKIKKTSKKLIN